MSPLPTLPFDAEKAIPHRLPMRLVDRIEEIGDNTCTVIADPRPAHLFADGRGRLSAEALLEMMAQSFAALRGIRMTATGKPVGLGFLVAVRGFQTTGEAHSSDRLTIRVRETGSVDAFHMADAEILRDRELLAAGSIRVWTPDDGGA